MTAAVRKHLLLLGSVVLVGLSAIFWLPTRFPPPVAWSDSYIFEYNNRLGEVLFIALALLVWLLAKVQGLRWPLVFAQGRSDRKEMPPKLLLGCLAMTAMLCAFYGWLTYHAGGIGDGAYFLDRIHLVERGEVPYRDFEFVYGSFPLYAPIFLGKLLRCSSTTGFYLLWAAETLAGVWLLWLAIRFLDMPALGKRTVFFLFCACAMILTMGVTLNYCFLRYSLPFFALAVLPHLDRERTRQARVTVGAAAALTVVLLLGLSPEEGVAFAVAFLLYLPIRRWALGRPWSLDTLLAAAAFYGLYRLAVYRGVFGTMARFGAGAFNLPLFPGLLLLFFFFSFLYVVVFHGSGPVRERAPSNLAFIMIYAFGMLPGALGRADGIHILGYELPLLAVALLLCRNRVALWRVATVGFVLSFYVLPIILGWHLGQPVLGKALLNHLYAHGTPTSRAGAWMDHYITRKAVRDYGAAGAAGKMTALRMAAEGRQLEPQDIFPGISPIVMAPFQYTPNKLSNYQSASIDEGYYMGLSNITVPVQVEQKIGEMRAHPERDLLVSNDGLRECSPLSDSSYAMKHLLLTPFVPEPRHTVYTFTPVCSYIRENYHWLHEPSNATYGYGIMRRNGRRGSDQASGSEKVNTDPWPS